MFFSSKFNLIKEGDNEEQRKAKQEKEKKTIEQEPQELERYTDLMVSDFDKKKGPFFEKIRAREKAKAKAAELKKLKGKK